LAGFFVGRRARRFTPGGLVLVTAKLGKMKTGEATSSFVPARDTCQATFRRVRAHLTGSLEEIYSRPQRFVLGDASDASP
jgi:hypothetical protein